MDKREIIFNVIQEKLNGRHPKNIHGNKLQEDLGLDSLDVMEIIMECEGKLGIRIYDHKCSGLTTIEDVYNLFEDESNFLTRIK